MKAVLLALLTLLALAEGADVTKTVREVFASGANVTRCSRCFFVDADTKKMDSCSYGTGHATLYRLFLNVHENYDNVGEGYFVMYPVTDQCFNDELYDSVSKFPSGDINYEFDYYRIEGDWAAHDDWTRATYNWDATVPPNIHSLLPLVRGRVYAKSSLLAAHTGHYLHRIFDHSYTPNGKCMGKLVLDLDNQRSAVTDPCRYRPSDSGNRGFIPQQLLNGNHGVPITWEDASGKVPGWDLGEKIEGETKDLMDQALPHLSLWTQSPDFMDRLSCDQMGAQCAGRDRPGRGRSRTCNLYSTRGHIENPWLPLQNLAAGTSLPEGDVLDGCPGVLDSLSSNKYDVWCLSRSKASEGYVYVDPGGNSHPETVVCDRHGGDAHRTPSGRCSCAGGTDRIGLGCEFVPPNGTDWVDYLLNHATSGAQVCADYGWALCSGHGTCVGDSSQRLGFRCDCGTDWFGTPYDNSSTSVYASEFGTGCGPEAAYHQHTDTSRWATRIIDWDQALQDSIALHQCMWLRKSIERQINYDNSAIERSGGTWNTHVPLNNRPVLGTSKTHHPVNGSIEVMSLGCSDTRGETTSPPNGLIGVPGILYGGINCEPCLPQNCSAEYGECLGSVSLDGSSASVSVCTCLDREGRDPAVGCVHQFCVDDCNSASGNGRCPREKAWDGHYRDLTSYSAYVGSVVTRDCECEPGYGGPACATALCPFAIDPHDPHAPPKMCGGHGKCAFVGNHTYITAVTTAGGVIPGTTQCECDSSWAAVDDSRTPGGSARADAGACVFGTCLVHGGYECNSLTTTRNSSTGPYTVCDNAPPSKAGGVLAACHCYANTDEAFRPSTGDLSSLRYGDACQYRWDDVCVGPGDTAPCTSTGNGFCYQCEEQLTGGLCTTDLSVSPSCHCKTSEATNQAQFTGKFCETPSCGHCNPEGASCLQQGGINICSCNPDYTGHGCYTHMEPHANETNECYEASDTEHTGPRCSGHSECYDCNDETANPECVGNVRWACRCPTSKAGRQCQIDRGCGENCGAGIGVCSSNTIAFDWANISDISDFVCTCSDIMSGTSYAGGVGDCGTDVCAATNGTHTGRGECACNEPGHIFIPHQGCRAACPHSPGGIECGVVHHDGSSRCDFATSTCDCTTRGIPGSIGEMLTDTDGYCQPYCQHCTQYQISDPPSALTSCLHPGGVIECDDADKINGTCQYAVTATNPCASKRCKNGGVLVGTTCVCTHPIFTVASDCAEDTCGAHGQPVAHDPTRCSCDLPYLMDHSDHTKCIDGCVLGTANFTSGVCDNCPFTRTGQFCHETICPYGELDDYSGCNCAHVPAATGPLCNVSLCENGGSQSADKKACICPAAWGGLHCTESLCGSHGTPAAGGAACDCDAGYEPDASSTVACTMSKCGSQTLFPVPCGGAGEPTCASGSYNYNCHCGSAANFVGGKCVHSGCVTAHSRVVLNATGHYCECHAGYSGSTCDTWACAGHENNPKVFYDEAAGECACSIPWKGVDGGCSEHSCGVGYPVPAMKNVRAFTSNMTVLNTTHYSPHAFVVARTQAGWDMLSDRNGSNTAVYTVARNMRWKCECPDRTVPSSVFEATQDGYTIQGCVADCNTAGTATVNNVTSLTNPCTCGTGYVGRTCHTYDATVIPPTPEATVPVYGIVGIVALVIAAGFGGRHAYQVHKAKTTKPPLTSAPQRNTPGSGSTEVASMLESGPAQT